MKHNAGLNRKPIILIVCNFYLPGYKAGGGLRTVVHMVERFQNKFDFRVITQDCDSDYIKYDSIKTNEWNDVNGIKVFYLSKGNLKPHKLRKLINEMNPDSIYLNSVFSVLSIYVLTLRKLKLIPKTNIIVAPEGELSESALQLKALKKKAFVNFAWKTKIYENLIWKATNETEQRQVEQFSKQQKRIFIAPNMPAKVLLETYQQSLKPLKIKGAAKFVFLSRMMKTKNFNWLVKNLFKVEGKLEIDVYGPIEDEIYWRETQKNIAELPENIKINYKGSLAYERVLETLFEYQFFILPTLGENFGHVFIEALAAGCPLIISDRTPWRNLQKENIGWDIPLEDAEKWLETINECLCLDDKSYTNISANARNFAQKWLSDPQVESGTLKVLQYRSSDTLSKRAFGTETTETEL